MKLQDVEIFFSDNELPFEWLADAGRTPMKATLSAGQELALAIGTAIVIPDVHLGIGPSDSFQETEPARVTRLERFLDVLALLRDRLEDDGSSFAAVQLGDFYDVMRTSEPGAPFAERLRTVFDAYPGVIGRAQKLPLLHCIGNHDHELFDHRAELPALGINAHIVRAIGPNVLACHGNDLVSLRDIELSVDYQSWLLSLIQTLVEMPVEGDVVERLQRYFDNSLQDPIFANTAHTSLAWPAAATPAAVPVLWSAPWVLRDMAAQLGEPLLDWERVVERRLDLAIIGHSHRPGIGWTEVDVERRIPLVDVGSWTYGRTNFAVVCSDGIGLVELIGPA